MKYRCPGGGQEQNTVLTMVWRYGLLGDQLQLAAMLEPGLLSSLAVFDLPQQLITD